MALLVQLCCLELRRRVFLNSMFGILEGQAGSVISVILLSY